MQQDSSSQDSWWHERPTKLGDLGTGYQMLADGRQEKKNVVWHRAILVVGLMFALVLSLVVMSGH